MKVAFNGVNREIVILPGVEEIDVQVDLYSEWKLWVRESDNAKYPAAFRTFGGDPTIENQFAPRYFFLINDWEIIAEDVSVDIATNLYSDNDGSSILVDNAAVTVRNSDAAVVDTSLEQSLDFNGVVYIDTDGGEAGTSYPIGTVARRVNNLTDALAIADFYGITNFDVIGEQLVIDQDLDSKTFRGSDFPPKLIFSGSKVNDSRFYQFDVSGNMNVDSDESVFLEQCIVGNLSGFDGVMLECTLKGTIGLSPNHQPRFLLLSESVSGISGFQFPVIEIPGGTVSVGTASELAVSDINIRHYAGGIGLSGSFGTGSKASFDINPGEVNLLEGITGGQIKIRGVGQFSNNINSANTNNVNIDVSGFYYDADNTSRKPTYNEKVLVDIIGGTSGNRFPIGTPGNAVNNIAEAIEIAQFYGFNKLELLSDVTITDDISNLSISSHNVKRNVIIDGATCANTMFEECKISGTFSGIDNNTPVTIVDSVVGNLDNMYGTIKHGFFAGNISLGENSINSFMDCRSLIPGATASPSISKYLGSTSSAVSLNVRSYSGGLELNDWNNADDVTTIEYIAGRANIDSSCVDGTVVLRGVGVLDNQSATSSNLNIITNGFLENTDIESIETELINIGESIDSLSQSITSIGSSVSYIGTTVSLIDSDVDYLVTQSDAQALLLEEVLGLVQKNYRITNQVYDINGLLESALIKTYANSNDAENDVNPRYQYEVEAQYDIDGRLIDYIVKDV